MALRIGAISVLGCLAMILAAGTAWCQEFDADKIRDETRRLHELAQEKKGETELELATMRVSAPDAESIALFRQASQEYTYQGAKVDAFADGGALVRLSRSSSTQVKHVAQQLMDASKLGDQAAQDANCSRLVEAVQLQMSVLMVRSVFQDEYDPQSLRDATDSRGALARMQEKILDSLTDELKRQQMLLDVHEAIASQLKLREKASIDEFAPKFFASTFHVARPNSLSVILTNRTGRSLHHCVFITRMVVDNAVTRGLEAQQASSTVIGDIFAAQMGAAASFIAIQNKLQEASWDLLRVDKSTVAYLEEWKPSGIVDMQPAAASIIMGIGKSMDWSMWSDEGYVDSSALPMEPIKAAIAKEFRPKPVVKKPPPQEKKYYPPPPPEYHPKIYVHQR